MQRFVKTLYLKNDNDLLKQYCLVHDNIWPEIVEGIKSVGISEMDIYLRGNLAVMIIECPDDIDIDEAMDKLAVLPKQDEWENYVARFQECIPGSTSTEKWKPMNKIFSLP